MNRLDWFGFCRGLLIALAASTPLSACQRRVVEAPRRSPTANDDPQGAEVAERQAREVIEENRRAEARYYESRGKVSPEAAKQLKGEE